MSKKKPLALPAVLDMAGAETLHSLLSSQLAPSETVTVSAGDVERVSTACIQLLIAFARSAEAVGGACRIESPSPVLEAAFADLGLSSELQSRRC